MNKTKPNKQPRPSYKDGKLRDPRIAEMQNEDYTRDDFLRVIERASSPQHPHTPETRATSLGEVRDASAD